MPLRHLLVSRRATAIQVLSVPTLTLHSATLSLTPLSLFLSLFLTLFTFSLLLSLLYTHSPTSQANAVTNPLYWFYLIRMHRSTLSLPAQN